MYSINIVMLFLKLFYMTAKCKLHESEQLIRSAWRSHAFCYGGFGGMLPRENFVKIR